MAFKSSRCAFSIIESSKRFCASIVRMIAGIFDKPAILEARKRLSPATILYFPSSRTTTIGCNTPCSFIELASAFKASSEKSLRGCSLSGIILSRSSSTNWLSFASSRAVISKSSSTISVGIKLSNPLPSPLPAIISPLSPPVELLLLLNLYTLLTPY